MYTVLLGDWTLNFEMEIPSATDLDLDATNASSHKQLFLKPHSDFSRSGIEVEEATRSDGSSGSSSWTVLWNLPIPEREPVPEPVSAVGPTNTVTELGLMRTNACIMIFWAVLFLIAPHVDVNPTPKPTPTLTIELLMAWLAYVGLLFIVWSVGASHGPVLTFAWNRIHWHGTASAEIMMDMV
ncbi:hypothetical protein BKA62DRAFT_802409 [Auriculariales sp. MPI-PUGE-AT-0066]|nr:hypothetical protein BKA62DRAFT_802409 [Auriculariales sp. MPI-PUGE-AT-0066]